MIIVGLVGRKGSGKDTLGAHLARKYGATLVSLAAPIKEGCKAFFDWTEDHVNGALKETIDPRWGLSPRQALQWFGTEVMQFQINESFQQYRELVGKWRRHWCVLLKEKILKMTAAPIVAITDMRFPHEANYFKMFCREIGHKFYTIKILRNKANKTDNHPSEIEMDQIRIDLTLSNNGTIEELYDEFDKVSPF